MQTLKKLIANFILKLKNYYNKLEQGASLPSYFTWIFIYILFSCFCIFLICLFIKICENLDTVASGVVFVFVKVPLLAAALFLKFVMWEMGPVIIFRDLFVYLISVLFQSLGYTAFLYSKFIELIEDFDPSLDKGWEYFKEFLAFNSTYIALLIVLSVTLLTFATERLNICLKKYWFYATILIFIISLYNLHYITPLQADNRIVKVVFFLIGSADVTEGGSGEENYELLQYYWPKKVGLLLSVLVGYIFILCAYVKQITCTKHEILMYVLLEYFLLKAFNTTNLLEFYIYYEAVLIPMYLLIIGWGSGESKKGLAAYYLVFYTVIFSIPFLTAVLYLGYKAGSYELSVIKDLKLPFDQETYVFWALFLGFAVKVPMFPFHIWLPEAHVNAPTTASVILASLLLKLGGYGMIVILLPICKAACFYYLPIMYALIVISIIYSSMAAIVQTDLKRIIAYSSIAHMNFAILGIFSWNSEGLQGSVYQMISHGITSAGLFFLVGFVYDRFHTRDITYYGGLTTVMPLYSTNFFFFTIANMGFPGTSAFVGELLIFVGSFKHNTVVSILALSGAFLSAVYSVWMFNRVCFGSLNTSYLGRTFFDLNRQEVVVMLYLFIPLIVLGVCPNIILDYLWYMKYFFE